MRWFLPMLVSSAIAWGNTPSPEDQAEMQRVTHQLVSAVNDRSIDRTRAVTTADFDAYMPGQPFFDGDTLKEFAEKLPEGLQSSELAVLVRGIRMVTNDVALGDAFYRTRLLPEGDSAGYLALTFVRTAGKWAVTAARFTPVPRTKPYVPVEPAPKHAPVSPEGWITLFDGGSADAFVSVDGAAAPNSWNIEDGTLKAVPGAGRHGLRTKDTFGSFELRFEWKTPPKGNSGVKYRLFAMFHVPTVSDALGHEYQLADDAGDPGAIRRAVERSGALYNQIAPRKPAVRPVGEFNTSVLIVRGRHCEHWLNGEKVVEYETESGPLEGPVLFQHHGTEMWFRDIRIRRLDDNAAARPEARRP